MTKWARSTEAGLFYRVGAASTKGCEFALCHSPAFGAARLTPAIVASRFPGVGQVLKSEWVSRECVIARLQPSELEQMMDGGMDDVVS